jgi:hypothetical protein
MRSLPVAFCAISLILPATSVRGQSLASRIDRVRDGEVRLSFATRSNACGNGEFIGVNRADAFWMYSSWDNGFSTNVIRDVIPDCAKGPLRLVVVKTAGRVTELRAAVGVAWRERASVTDLGTVSAPDAAEWLVGLAEGGNERVLRVAFLAASVADGSQITERVVAIARNRQASEDVREQALRWLEPIAAAEGRGDQADRTLKALAEDRSAGTAIRERAIRSLSASTSNRAYLRSLYGRVGESALKERILRTIGNDASAEEVRWVRDIALDPREATALRERAVRVLGNEPGRAGDVRDLYAKLDETALRERALRVVAEQDVPGVVEWLRGIAEDRAEATSIRDRAIRLLAERGQLADLQKMYPRLDRAELRGRVLRSAAESGGPDAAAWLTKIVLDQGERSDLRERAVRELEDRGVPSADLASLYDRVEASVVKRRLVRLLADRGDDAAIRKLSAIAESDPDPGLRREANRRLGDKSRDR